MPGLSSEYFKCPKCGGVQFYADLNMLENNLCSIRINKSDGVNLPEILNIEENFETYYDYTEDTIECCKCKHRLTPIELEDKQCQD